MLQAPQMLPQTGSLKDAAAAKRQAESGSESFNSSCRRSEAIDWPETASPFVSE